MLKHLTRRICRRSNSSADASGFTQTKCGYEVCGFPPFRKEPKKGARMGHGVL